MKYTFKQLEYFIAVADYGSIIGAAEKIHISSPSISVAIAQLEESLATRLFTRQHSGLELTAAGLEVLIHARLIIEKAENLQNFGNLLPGELSGKIKIGCLSTLAPLVLVEICKSFSYKYPAVTIEFIEGSQDQLIGHLRRGIIDISITYEMHIPQDLWFESLAELPPIIIIDENHRFAKAKSVNMRDLESDAYILLDLPISRDYFLSLFEKVNVIPNIRIKTTNFEVIRTMVANGQGISISTARPINQFSLDGKLIISLPISNPLPALNLGILSRKSEFNNLTSILKRHIQEIITTDNIPGMRSIT